MPAATEGVQSFTLFFVFTFILCLIVIGFIYLCLFFPLLQHGEITEGRKQLNHRLRLSKPGKCGKKEKNKAGLAEKKDCVHGAPLSLSRSVARYGLKSCKCSAQVDTRMIETFFRGFWRGRLILNRNIFAIKRLARSFVVAADPPAHDGFLSGRIYLRETILMN